MDGAKATVRPPQPRSGSIAQTVQSQAPTAQSSQDSRKETANESADSSSDATPSDPESIRADHVADPIDEQPKQTLGQTGQFSSKPVTARPEIQYAIPRNSSPIKRAHPPASHGRIERPHSGKTNKWGRPATNSKTEGPECQPAPKPETDTSPKKKGP